MFSSALHLPETHDIRRIEDLVRYISFGNNGASLEDLAECLSFSRVDDAHGLMRLACFLGFLKNNGNAWEVTSTGLLFVAVDDARQRLIVESSLRHHRLYKFVLDKVIQESQELPSVSAVQNAISLLAKKNKESVSSAGGYLRNAAETVIELILKATSKDFWSPSRERKWFNPYLGPGKDFVSDKTLESYRRVLTEKISPIFEDKMNLGEGDVIAALLDGDTRREICEEDLLYILELCLCLTSQSYFCFIAWSAKYHNSILLLGGQEPSCFATFVSRSLAQLGSAAKESVCAAFRPCPEHRLDGSDSTSLPVKKLMTHLNGASSFFAEQLDGILDDNYIEWQEISRGLDESRISQLEALTIKRIARLVLSKEPQERLDEQLDIMIEELLQVVITSSQFRMELIDCEKLWGMAKEVSLLLLESYSKQGLFDNLRCRLRVAGHLHEREIGHGCLLPTVLPSGAVTKSSHRVDARSMKWLSWISSQRTALSRDVRLRVASLEEMKDSYQDFVAERYSGSQCLEWSEAKNQILSHLRCSERGGRLRH